MVTSMVMSSTSQLFTNVPDSAECSTSSCPPSATSDESVPEGYLILTFDKTKRAKLKTAVFADVSDCQFADDYDDDNYGDDVEDGLLWPNNDAGDVPTESSMAEANLNSEQQNMACYGEAVWVGENEASENVHPSIPTTQTPGNAHLPSLIRTSHLSTPPQNNLTPKSLDPKLQCFEPISKLGTLSNVISPTKLDAMPPRQMTIKSLSVAARPRTTSFLRHRLLPNARMYDDDIMTDNDKYPRKMLRCEACGKYYRNWYSLHHHICLKRKDVWKKGDVPSQVIDGQLVYFCPTCRKPFKWLGNLTRHFYVHTGQRFFKCDVCSKEFFSAYQVKRHMNSHTGRRFKCEVCDKPFTCKYACAWHTRQHYTNPV